MMRAWFLMMVFAAATPEVLAAETPAAPGANAALKYWQAFATLPSLSDADSQRLSRPDLETPPSAEDRQIAAAAENSLTMLRRGTALTRCDWGIGYEDGIAVRFPHVAAAFTLSPIACLGARIRVEDGRNAEAIDDLLAVMILGRHVSAGGASQDLLAGYEVEHRAIDTLARELPRIKPSDLKALMGRLKTLPPGARPALAMHGDEQLVLDWFVRSVSEAKDQQALLALLRFVDQVCSLPDKHKDPDARARAFLDACGGDARGVLKRAEEIRPLYELLAKKLDLPFERFAIQWKAEEANHAGNPVMQAFFGRILRVRFQQARMEVRRAYLAAALDVRLNGRTALARHNDPVVGNAIEYRSFPGGFELRSKLKWEQDTPPVALIVGRRVTGAGDPPRSTLRDRPRSARGSL